jgi:cell shape-determining protein MreD
MNKLIFMKVELQYNFGAVCSMILGILEELYLGPIIGKPIECPEHEE